MIAGLLLLASCRERGAVSKAQGTPVDQRYGLARLDSAFALNDPYAGFGRPNAAVSATPPEIRSRFRRDLEALFGGDDLGRAQLDSARDIIVFNPALNDTFQAWIVHVADLIAGDRYFLYLKHGANVSLRPWSWYGPAAAPAAGGPFPRQSLASIEKFPDMQPAPCLVVNEWRHNGNSYAAWLRTYIRISGDLALSQQFRFEAFSNGPLDHPDWYVARRLTHDFLVDEHKVQASLRKGSSEKIIGSALLKRDPENPVGGWRLEKREIQAPELAKFLWSASPLGEAAISQSLPE